MTTTLTRAFWLAGCACVLAATSAYAGPHWSGLYLGGVIGYEHQDSDIVDSFTPAINYGGASFDGPRLGGVAGWNFMMGPGFLVGVEGDLVTHLGAQSSNTLVGITGEWESDYTASVRLRAGFIAQNVLVFATGGYGWTQMTGTAAPIYGFTNPVVDDTVGGWVIGVGFETFLSDNWSVGVQLVHAMYDDSNASITFGSNKAQDPTGDAVDISLRWHFGND